MTRAQNRAETGRAGFARAGLTLVELVVALAVAGIVVTGGYAAFGFVADQREAASARAERDQRAARVRAALTLWLANAAVGRDADRAFRGLGGSTGLGAAGAPGIPSGTGADDRLAFLTHAPSPLPHRSARVSIRVLRDSTPMPQGVVAELTPLPAGRTERLTLSREATGLDIRYLASFSGERRWLPSWVSTSVLPAAVEVRLLPADSLDPLLARPILVALGGQR